MRALTAVLILAVAAPAAAQDEEEKKQKKMNWTTDYKAALKTAEKDGKLVIVHFWADW